MKTTMYGYINSYSEKSENQAMLKGAGTSTTRGQAQNNVAYEVRDIHFVMQSTLGDRFKSFLNLRAPGANGVEVSNAWVEAKLAGDYLSFRLGKMYRPFEIYNEILDAVPTYIGIEPPELFDTDHLMVTRTTNMMFHGITGAGDGLIRYAVTTGNDERSSNELPVGVDVRYIKDIKWTFGTSAYTSGGNAKPINEYVIGGGSGSPEGGVLPWMDSDQYNVYGAYAQYLDDRFTIQASYFIADHKAQRNLAAVQDMCNTASGTPLNRRQQSRFNCATAGSEDVDGDYQVKAWYVRAGYNLPAGNYGNVTPYLQYDSYTNEETIQDEDHGGDNEAGQSDDGHTEKWTAGMVYRPLTPVAVKADYSLHNQDVMGKDGSYGEVRFSLSYYWRM